MKSIPIFKGVESDTEVVTNIPNGVSVELLKRKTDGNTEWDRCMVKYKEYKGWLGCGWLEEKVEIYVIDTSELKAGGLDDSSIRLWKSYSDRKLVTNIPKKAKVNLLQKDETNNYCKIKYKENVGWLSCNWLRKA